MVLNLLELVVVTDVELVLPHLGKLLLQPFFLFRERLERAHYFFHLVLLVGDEVLEIFVFLLQLVAVLLPVCLGLHVVLYLPIFELNQLPQVFVFLPQRVRFVCELLLLLLAINDLLLPVFLGFP